MRKPKKNGRARPRARVGLYRRLSCLRQSPWRRQRRPLVPAESITNNQSAGVDEGGIAEVHGKHLFILRGGRLFTVDVDRNQFKPVASLWGASGLVSLPVRGAG